jgi:hypothetical protein
VKINEMMERWRRAKRRFAPKRLEATCTIEHEHGGAFVRFECAPAEELAVTVRVSWPPGTTTERSRLDDAVAAAVIDALAAGESPCQRCVVTLVDAKWSGAGDDETAFYLATLRAMTTLRDAHPWTVVTKR